MITCGHCGCLVSPEIKKGKYVYYSCTNAKGNYHRDYINENVFLKEIAQYFDDISLSEELVQQITLYLKDIYEAEGKFYREQKTRLRKEQDQIQQRISKMYDDRYDRKLQEYKARERDIVQEMERHVNADESFHVTANMVLSLARRARTIFESSEVEEKRQLLNFVFQNLELKEKKLFVDYREPFKMIKDTSFLGKCPAMCPSPHSPRTNSPRECAKSMTLNRLSNYNFCIKNKAM